MKDSTAYGAQHDRYAMLIDRISWKALLSLSNDKRLTSSDAIEHSTNNNRFIEQKPESPSGISLNFFTSQNQADFDGMHTTSHKMKSSIRFCVRFGPFHLEY